MQYLFFALISYFQDNVQCRVTEVKKVIFHVQVEAEDVPEISQHYEIECVPTFIILKVMFLFSCNSQ